MNGNLEWDDEEDDEYWVRAVESIDPALFGRSIEFTREQEEQLNANKPD